MNTVDYNNTGANADGNLVGVDQNRMVVTNRPKDFGTFAVTTDQDFNIIPFAKAKSFRINNLTGKVVGIRRRHKSIVVDDFNDISFAGWNGSGTIETGSSLEGARGAEVNGLKYKVISTTAVGDDSEVEVSFKTPSADYSIKIGVWDNETRVTTPGASASAELTLDQSNSTANTVYKVVFRLRNSTGKADVFLDQGLDRQTISSDQVGEFGTASMANCVIAIESSKTFVVDPIIYQQKVSYSNELMYSTSSYSFPCEDNISEYEVINLGSDVMNYSDNTATISLSGFYAS